MAQGVGWKGEPRVIYNDVLERVDRLKADRISAYRSEHTSDTGALSASSDSHRSNGDGMGSGSSGDANSSSSSSKRFVNLMFDPPGRYNRARYRLPEVSVVDVRGNERRQAYSGLDIGPLEVGSVLVLRDASLGQAQAAYFVGKEEHQVLIVGNGVACSPTLLGAGLLREGDDGEEIGRAGAGSSLGRNSNSSNRRDGSPDKAPVLSPDIQVNMERAALSRGAALRKLVGIGGNSSNGGRSGSETDGGSLTAHELFRQAADLGDPESFFYLALLQSAGLHGGEAGAGKDQARTWALCGTHASNTNANLLLAYRFHSGLDEEEGLTCQAAVRFYGLAVDELRLGLEDASQELYPAADAFRLGNEHGLGVWGVTGGLGGAGGLGYLPGGVVGADGGGGGGGGGPARDVGFQDDMLLRAEAGDPSATIMMGYLHMIGSEAMGISPDFAKAEQLMWRAVRNGDPGGYFYLAWMHHNGHIGGHLPPDQQPRLPDGGAKNDPRAAADRRRDSRKEEDLRAMAFQYWGKERVEESNAGRGVFPASSEDEGGEDAATKRGWSELGGAAGRLGGGGGGSGGRGIDQGDDVSGGDFDHRDHYGDGWRGQWHGGGDGGEGKELRPGEDVWSGEASDESWEWETIGGGVSGAIAAADLYVDGFKAGDPACGTGLADMWLHSEYSDTRDGRGAGGKYAMLQAYLLFSQALEMGRQLGEPQAIAALRMGSMFQHGLVPYLGYNTTEALAYYQESADNGGMDAILVLAELHLEGFKGALEKSCTAAADLYQKYANLCIKNDALAYGRITFEEGQYQEAFVHYLIAAEQGNKEGQASLAWLLDRSMAAAPSSFSPLSLLRRVWDGLRRVAGGRGGAGGVGESGDAGGGSGGDTGTRGVEAKVGGLDEVGRGVTSGGRGKRRSGVGGVVDAVRQMGGDPEAMARRYRRLAADQGDSEARCAIADDLYRKAKAGGAVPPGIGWLPAWARDDSNSNDQKYDRTSHGKPQNDGGEAGVAGIGAAPGGFGRVGSPGYGRESEGERLARESDAAGLLSDALAYYRLAAEAEDASGGPGRRGLFSMGWMYQHGVGVEADPALARQFYRQSGSAPAVLGLWLMGVSEFAVEVGAPLAMSAVIVAATMLAMKFRRTRGRALSAGAVRGRRGHRQPVQAAAAAVGRVGGAGRALGRALGSAMLIEREGGGERGAGEAVVDGAAAD